VTNETPAVISGGGTLKIDQTVRIHQEGPGRRAASVPEVLGRNEDCGPCPSNAPSIEAVQNSHSISCKLARLRSAAREFDHSPFVLFPVSGEWGSGALPPARFDPPPPC
jgi:hypothetical protein